MKLQLTKGGFAEIYSNGLEFCLLDSAGVVYNGTTCCKDFFTDAFWAEHHKQSTSIHGFKCTPGRMDLAAPSYQLALHKSKESLGLKAGILQQWLRRFDLSYGFQPLSTVEPINDEKDVLITFSAAWAARPVLVSLLTGMMRVGLMAEGDMKPKALFAELKANGNPYGQYDQDEFFMHDKVVPLILSSLSTGVAPHAKQTFEQYAEAYSAHHGGGFIAFTDGRQTG